MWAIAGAVTVSIVALLIEIPILRKLKQYKEMAAFVFLTAASLTLFIMQSLHVYIPNPLDWVKVIYGQLGLVLPK